MSEIKYATVVPLIGGMTIGNKLAFGKDPEFFASYSAFGDNDSLLYNHMPNVPRYDIENDSFVEIAGSADVVSTVCPCAGLSMMNAGNRGASAPQNEWMFKTAKFVLETLQPKVMFGENAPGLFTNLGKEVADKLYEIGKERGYSFSLIRTNTALHGIPQRRIRTFYFFWKSDFAPVMNYYKRDHKHYIDYLKEIPTDATQQEVVADKSADVSYLYVKTKLTEDQIFSNNSTVDLIFQYNLYDDYVSYLESKGDEVELKKIVHIKTKLDAGKGFWNSFPHLGSKEDPITCSCTGRSMDRLIHPVEIEHLRIVNICILWECHMTFN